MMTHDTEEPNRRDFLKAATLGGAALAAAGLPGSSFAAEGKATVQGKPADRPVDSKVELLFLGTGAANWPSEYPPPEKSLAKGSVRGMSCMLVNREVLIDCGPTALAVMKRYEVDPAGITDILLTHTHADHFHTDSILAIAEARDAALGPLKFWDEY